MSQEPETKLDEDMEIDPETANSVAGGFGFKFKAAGDKIKATGKKVHASPKLKPDHFVGQG